ncbi:MAG TPA: cytochrome c peroxidase [Bacteroidales bacterium]|nr:cytochrome c peroxidase [Bacteroidales bacterium]
MMVRVAGFILLILSFTSCGGKQTDHWSTTPYQIEIPFGFPSRLNIPADNPLTVEGVELGRYLFYDGRLTGRTHPDSLMSCATCHIQSRSFEAGIDHPRFQGGRVHGITGIQTRHVMLPLINLVWNHSAYGWNGFVYPENPNTNLRNIEDLVRVAVMAEDEMAADTTKVKQLFQQLEGYPELFHKAFGSSKISFRNIERAIAQFVRTLVSANSRFDRYLRGEIQLNPDELRGFVLFTSENGADCFHCHGGGGNPLFTTHLFYNNGKDTVFDNLHDRYFITGNTAQTGAFKAPTLRNIALTAPYMHDGRFANLDEVIDFYSTGVKYSPFIDPLMHHVLRGGVQLTPGQKNDLKAFLHALTDEDFLHNPAYGRPDKFPDEQ